MTQEEEEDLERVKKELKRIHDEGELELKRLRLEWDKYGFVEKINGGFTCRMGNEVKDFEKAFGSKALDDETKSG